MASRRFDILSILGLKRVVVQGRFFTNGVSNPVAASTKGKGFTVTRTGVGAYLVTFADKYVDLDSVLVSVQFTGATVTVANAGNYDAAAKTLVIRVNQDSGGLIGATDLAANANNSVSFYATFRNTSVNF